jgi:hypothetical protein
MNRQPVHWTVRPLWAAATTLGIALGFVLIYAIIAAIKLMMRGFNEDRAMGTMLAPALAICVAVLQWLVLKRYIARAGWWIIAGMTGWIFAFAILRALTGSPGALMALAARTDTTLYSVAFMLVFGLVSGVVQWPILRQHTRWASLWIPACMIGLALTGAAIGKSIDRVEDMAALGAIPGAVTGLALFLLLRQPRTAQAAR